MTKICAVMAMLAATLLPRVVAAEGTAEEVVLDNPSVRVTVRTFAPTTGSGRHQGMEPEVGIVTEGELTLETPEGTTVVRQGSAYWVPGLTPHDARNEGSKPAKLYEIFLKRSD